MKYHSGRMGIAEGLALAFITSFPQVFLSIPAVFAALAGPAIWAIPIIGGIVSGSFLGIHLFLLNRYQGDLLTLSERLLGKPAAVIIGLFFFFVMFGTACLWTRQYAENTLLTALPNVEFQFVILLYAISAILLVGMGIEVVSRATYLLIPFCIVGLVLVFIGLTNQLKPLYIFPLLGSGLPSFVDPILLFVGASVPVTILLILAPSFQNIQTVRAALFLGFGGSIILRSIANGVYIMVFSAAIAAEKTLPFFEMARLVYINRFLQRLEALFILLWVIVGVLGIAACLYGALYIIARLCKLPTVKPLLLPVCLIMANIAAIPPDAGTVLDLGIILYINVFSPGLAVITLVLLAAAWVKGGGGKRCELP